MALRPTLRMVLPCRERGARLQTGQLASNDPETIIGQAKQMVGVIGLSCLTLVKYAPYQVALKEI